MKYTTLAIAICLYLYLSNICIAHIPTRTSLLNHSRITGFVSEHTHLPK